MSPRHMLKVDAGTHAQHIQAYVLHRPAGLTLALSQVDDRPDAIEYDQVDIVSTSVNDSVYAGRPTVELSRM